LPGLALAVGNYWMVRKMFTDMPLHHGAFDEAIARYVDGLSLPGALKAALDYSGRPGSQPGNAGFPGR
jgi:hypothetical protein